MSQTRAYDNVLLDLGPDHPTRLEIAWKRRPRQRSIRLSVRDGRFIVTSSKSVTATQLQRMLLSSRSWILTQLAKPQRKGFFSRATKTEFEQRKTAILEKLLPEVKAIALEMGVEPRAVRLRCNQRVWGSCSTTKAIQFHYQIADLPPEVRRYLIVHELAHLVYHSHKPEFWKFVQSHCIEYRYLRAQLREVS